jgi:acyl carrier protein
MDNTQKYNEAFVHVFGAQADDLNDEYGKDTVQEWDSVHQLSLVAELEEAFDIMLDPEDIMELTSYKNGKELLKKYDIEL